MGGMLPAFLSCKNRSKKDVSLVTVFALLWSPLALLWDNIVMAKNNFGWTQYHILRTPH